MKTAKSTNQVKTTKKLITPAIAAEILHKNTKNRPLIDGVVTMLAKQMRDGGWVFNGEPIIISSKGVLLDGQHRLTAIMRSKVSLEMVVFDMMREISKEQIIWGGNYFTDYLPPTMHWLIWDKGQRDFSLADGEVAWGSQHRALRIFGYARGKALQDGKQHPTQKPVELMKWCIDELPPKTESILDPFMGSGTTLVACAKMGRSGIGIELDEAYYNIACDRVEDAYKQSDMFIEPPKPKQEKLL